MLPYVEFLIDDKVSIDEQKSWHGDPRKRNKGVVNYCCEFTRVNILIYGSEVAKNCTEDGNTFE